MKDLRHTAAWLDGATQDRWFINEDIAAGYSKKESKAEAPAQFGDWLAWNTLKKVLRDRKLCKALAKMMDARDGR